MHARYRLASAALCTDLALYLIMLSLPYRLLDQGASSAVLGLVPFLYAGPYAVVALFAGRVSDRFPRRGPIRAGLTVAIASAIGLATVNDVTAVLLLVPGIGLGLGFFWPSLQAGFSEVSQGRDLHRLTGLFNVSWSLGKGLGLLAGGWLLELVGAPSVAAVAACSFAASALVLPRMGKPGDHSEAIAADPDAPSPDRQRAFLRAAWIANGVAFGVVATINHHLPRVLLEHDVGARDFGTFFGWVFFAQTALFVVLGPRRGWHFRAAPLIAFQALLVLATLAVTQAGSLGVLLAFAPVIGAALGFAYQSSLYYSLHAPHARGAQAGIHEAALGSSSAAIPLIGGAAVGTAGPIAPFVVASAALLASTIFGAVTIRRTRPTH